MRHAKERAPFQAIKDFSQGLPRILILNLFEKTSCSKYSEIKMPKSIARSGTYWTLLMVLLCRCVE